MTDFQQIVSQRPRDIDEAIACMRKALDYYHEQDDYRAVFLRAYYIITLNVHAAVHQLGDYKRQIFFDPNWISALAGKFSSLYFQSLTTFERDATSERAWKIAHQMAQEKTSTVVQDLILGLNAHINYDLAYGIYLNLKEHGDQRNHLLLPRRKFDHDQVNNILMRSMPQIVETLTRDYGGEILFLRRLTPKLDDFLTQTGLKYYRERVWWSAISYLTTTGEEEIKLVQDKLNHESTKVAKLVADKSWWGFPMRVVGCALRKTHFCKIDLGRALERYSGTLSHETNATVRETAWDHCTNSDRGSILMNTALEGVEVAKLSYTDVRFYREGYRGRVFSPEASLEQASTK
jgi:hypothetical protein